MNDLRNINSQILSEEQYAGGYGYSQEKKEDVLDFRSLWRFLLGYKWSILFITLVSLMISVVISLSITPSYLAIGTVEIQPESEYGHKINEQKGQPTDKSFYQTQYEFLRSKTLAARVIDKLGIRSRNVKPLDHQAKGASKPLFSDLLYDTKLWLLEMKQSLGLNIGTIISFPETKTNLGKIPQETLFLKKLKIIPLKNARIVTIEYEHSDPEMASKIVNTLANEFIAMNRERRSESMSDAQKYFKKQLAITKIELDAKEKALTVYAKRHSLLTTGNNETLVEKRLLELSLAVTLAENKRIEMESRYKNNSIGVGQLTINPSLDNGVMRDLKLRKHKKQAEYDTLLGLKNHVDIDVITRRDLLQQIRREINALQKRINAEQRRINQAVKTERNINHRSLKNAFLSADQKLRELRKELEAQKKRSFIFQDQKVGYDSLKRKVEIKRQSYNELLRKAQAIKIASKGGKNNISVLDKADIPYRQFKPNLKINLPLGVIIGLFLGVALSFLRNMFNDTVRSSEEIEKLSKLPILGNIPKIKTRKAKTQARLTYDKPKSAIAEACRSLRTTLLFSTDGDPKVLLITSPMPNEGKTTTAVNLASAFVQAGKKVLLIDADLRKPSLHNRLKLDNSIGLATCLVGEYDIDKAIQSKVLGDLSVLTAGQVKNNPVGLFSSEKMEDLLKELSLTYDNIILDAPPVMGLADSLLLANISSATLMVVSHGQTNGRELTAACNKIRQARGSLIGCIYTKVGAYDDGGSQDIYAYGNQNNYGLIR